MNKDYPGVAMRFRTSTNREDLKGFPCAGCYESHTGDPIGLERRLGRNARGLGQAEGETVLSTAQVHQLGVALQAIHDRFSPAYGSDRADGAWYAMDVEFKFDNERRSGSARAAVREAGASFIPALNAQ